MEAALRGAPDSVGQHHCQEYKGHSGEPGPSLRVDHGLVGAADGGSHLYCQLGGDPQVSITLVGTSP